MTKNHHSRQKNSARVTIKAFKSEIIFIHPTIPYKKDAFLQDLIHKLSKLPKISFLHFLEKFKENRSLR
jgi:hypothetical protein